MEFCRSGANKYLKVADGLFGRPLNLVKQGRVITKKNRTYVLYITNQKREVQVICGHFPKGYLPSGKEDYPCQQSETLL